MPTRVRGWQIPCGMPELKARLQSDLNTAMKARDELTTATLRMTLTAITNDEVAGKHGARALRRRGAAGHRPRGEEAARGRRGVRRSGTRPSWPRASGPRARCSTATCPPSSATRSWPTGPRRDRRGRRHRAPRHGRGDEDRPAAVAGRADGKRVSDEVRRQLGRLSPAAATRPPDVVGRLRAGGRRRRTCGAEVGLVFDRRRAAGCRRTGPCRC